MNQSFQLRLDDGQVIEVVADVAEQIGLGSVLEGEVEQLAAGGPWLQGDAVPEVTEGVLRDGGSAGGGCLMLDAGGWIIHEF